jgi:hypothetical protein
MDAIIAINATYIQTKGKTFFANQLMLDKSFETVRPWKFAYVPPRYTATVIGRRRSKMAWRSPTIIGYSPFLKKSQTSFHLKQWDKLPMLKFFKCEPRNSVRTADLSA